MATTIFRGAVISYADLRHEKESGYFVRLHMRADLSGPVMEAMGWDDVPESVTSCKLAGELSGRHLVMRPNARDKRQHEMQLECSDVTDFQVTRKQGEDDETVTSLVFIARSKQVGAMALIERWFEAVGKSPAQLMIAYETQGQLFDAAEAQNAKFEEVPDEPQQAAPAETQEGLNLQPSAPEPALASVSVMPDMEERHKKRQMRRGEKPLGTPVDHAAKSGVTDEDWNREQQEDPDVPHHLPEVLQ